MSDEGECFGIGSVLTCETCFNEEFQGELIAYDPSLKLITLKSKVTSGKSQCNINFINLNFVSNVKVLKEAGGGPLPSLPYLDLNKLSGRLKRSIDEKSKLLLAIKSGSTVNGQRLYLTIAKTFEQLTWSGPDIVVMGQVIIQPPYGVDNVKDLNNSKDCNSKAIIHIKKIVDKYHKDQEANCKKSDSAVPNSTSTPNQATSSSSKEVQPLSQ